MSTNTDYAVPTGDFIMEWLEESGLSQAELARRLGVTPKHVSKLLSGAVLTPEIATKLELVTSISARIWLSYEATYRADVARLALQEELANRKDLAQLFPLKHLRDCGRTSATLRTPGVALMELLAFFGVGSVGALELVIDRQAVAYRQGTAHAVDEYALATWLRLAELEASTSDSVYPAYDEEAVRKLLPGIRASTRNPGPAFGEKLIESLRAAGVQLIFVPEVKGARMFGATRWVEERPVIALTARGRDDGQFWFTLFHELGHVLLHRDNRAHIRPAGVDSSTDPAEREANEFASEQLIPQDNQARLTALKSLDDVKAFARDLGVSPGVVVGRLHHDRLWEYSRGQKLFIKMTISE